MPLFDTEYEVEIFPDYVGWEATDEWGSKILFSPHICSSHRNMEGDHRGWIDMTILQMTPVGILVPLETTSLSLTQVSIMIEGLTQVGGWAYLNQELGDD